MELLPVSLHTSTYRRYLLPGYQINVTYFFNFFSATYFWVGRGSTPDENGMIIPDETGRYVSLSCFVINSKINVLLPLPFSLLTTNFGLFNRLRGLNNIKSFMHVVVVVTLKNNLHIWTF